MRWSLDSLTELLDPTDGPAVLIWILEDLSDLINGNVLIRLDV